MFDKSTSPLWRVSRKRGINYNVVVLENSEYTGDPIVHKIAQLIPDKNNALLMSAAPEMLDALSAAARVIDSLPDIDKDTVLEFNINNDIVSKKLKGPINEN